MLELSQWVNGLPISLVLRRIGWFVPLLQSLHILSVGIVLSSLMMVALRAWGVAGAATPAAAGRRFLPWMWAALAVATVTGIGLMLGAPRSFRDGAFLAKLYLMGAAAVATLALGVVLRVDGSLKDARVPAARLIGAVAIVLWLGATLAGRGRWIAGMLGG
jgi:uncharacterized membrane protein